MNTRWISSFFLIGFVLFSAQAQDRIVDKAHAAQLKLANVELTNKTAVLMADDVEPVAEPTLAEQLYRMVFKRDAKAAKEEKEENKESEPKATTPATTETSPKPEETTKHDKTHHKGHKGHHKKHKHSHHKHHKDNNGTEVDWHSIG